MTKLVFQIKGTFDLGSEETLGDVIIRQQNDWKSPYWP